MDEMKSSIQTLLQREAQAVLNIPVTDNYEKAVALIVEQVHRKRGKLVTSGMGKAGQIAMNIATTFCSTGIPAVFLHPSEAQHGDLGILQENGHPDEVCVLGMTPTTSTTVMTVIGDILVVETMKQTGFTIEEYSKRHHGGYLGERSRELSK